MSETLNDGFSVEITHPKGGSAHLIGGRLVLTCAHVVGEVGTLCKVRSNKAFGTVDGKVVWVHEAADLALIELPEESIKVRPAKFGRFPPWHPSHQGVRVPYSFFGYPAWLISKEQDSSKFYGGQPINGEIPIGAEVKNDRFSLEARQYPSVGTYDASDSAQSPWKGASGAAVFFDKLIVAVLRQHTDLRNPERLTAQPLQVVYDDPKWQSLLYQHGVNPECQEIILPQSKPRSPTVESRNSPRNIDDVTNYIDLLNWIEEKSRRSSTGIRSLSPSQRTDLRRQIKLISGNSLEPEVPEMKVLELVVHYVFYCLERGDSPVFGRMPKTKYMSQIKQYHRSGTLIRSGNSSLSSLIEKSEEVLGKVEIANLVKKMEKSNEL
jgi:hypothetical protein